jgi:hypothetical protein
LLSLLVGIEKQIRPYTRRLGRPLQSDDELFVYHGQFCSRALKIS